MKLLEKDKRTVISAIKNHIANGIDIYFFGSRVEGDPSETSDLDVLLKGKGPIDLAKISGIKEDLEDSDIPFKIDVLDYHRCSEQMLKNISKNLVKVA